jgi:hypothetical protein
VGEPVEVRLGLGLVGRDVVGHLGRQQLAALVAVTDRERAHDRRVRGGDRLDLGDHLGVRVEAAIAGGVVGRGGGGAGERDARDKHQGEGGGQARHAPSLRDGGWPGDGPSVRCAAGPIGPGPE